MQFEDFKLDPGIMEGLDAMGFKSPTPIQEQAIPPILENKDLIGCAQTGTGKTAAYLLPVIHKILQHTAAERKESVNCLVVAPTRELAMQIDQQVEGFAYFAPVNSRAVIGGRDSELFDQEKRALQKGADIIIATPGRLLTHLNLGYVKIGHLEHLILDEADRMLDMGFLEDILRIVNHLPKERQTLMFSATMPPKIRQLAKRILKDPVEINISPSKPAEGILQGAYLVYGKQKTRLVKQLLTDRDLPSVLIFSATKSNAKALRAELKGLGLKVEDIHSDLEQSERKEALRKFKNRDIQMLVATDILARGIDIEDVSLVLNYDVPNDPEDYIHRVGRTARAASTGVALTFVNDDPKEQRKFQQIEKFLGNEVPKMPLPPELGEGPAFTPSAGRGGGGRYCKGGKGRPRQARKGRRKR